jgi:phage tail sheath gpL-like
MSISTAITPDRVSAVSGYEVAIDRSGVALGNLPQRIDIFAEKASAKQAAPAFIDAFNANQVGQAYGFNSPAYAIARILLPLQGGKLGGIPTVFWGVDEAASATSKDIEIEVTGTATRSATHVLRVCGRTSIDGFSYAYTVAKGDTPAMIAQKISDTINRVLGSPFIATSAAGIATAITGWKGKSAGRASIEIDMLGESAGISYSIETVQAAAGVPSLSTTLPQIGEAWVTHVVNGIGNELGILDYLEEFNGNIKDKTGRFKPDVFKPFFAYTGTTIKTFAGLEAAFPGHDLEQTNIIAVSPNSPCMDFEIAADWCYNYAPVAQNSPHSCLLAKEGHNFLNNIVPPANGDIGDFSDSEARDRICKAGFCTVKLTANKYEVLDFVTTYNAPDEPQTTMAYRFVRDLTIRYNLKYVHELLQKSFVTGKTIVGDLALVSPGDTISPAQWRGILEEIYFPDMIDRKFITKYENLQVGIGKTNGNRFEDAFTAVLTGIARVISTTIRTKFNF